MLRLTRLGELKLLSDLLTDTGDTPEDGLLFAGHIGLIKEMPQWSPGLLTADIVPPVYTTYARQPLVPGEPAIRNDGRSSVRAEDLIWRPTAVPSGPQLVIGVALYSALTAGDLWGVDLFLTPAILESELSELNTRFELALPAGQASWGETDIES